MAGYNLAFAPFAGAALVVRPGGGGPVHAPGGGAEGGHK